MASNNESMNSSLTTRCAQWIARLVSVYTIAAMPTSAIAAESACDRSCLTAITEQYLDALAARDATQAPLAQQARITENGQVLTSKQGLWASMVKRGITRILAVDPQLGQVGYLGTVEETAGPAEVSLRLKVQDRKITEVETIVQRDERDLILPLLQTPDPLFQGELPRNERLPRAELARIMNSYFEAIRTSDASRVPLHPKAVRNENGEQKHNDPENAKRPSVGQQIDMGLAQAVGVRDLRIAAIDEVKGLAYVQVMIDYHGGVPKTTTKDGKTVDIPTWIQRPHSWICAEGFAIKNGQIRQLEAIFVRAPYHIQSGWAEAAQ